MENVRDLPEISGVFVDTRIKVVDPDSSFYKFRGKIKSVQYENPEDTKSKIIGYWCNVHENPDDAMILVQMLPWQIDTIQKKFIDIEHIRENDIDLGNGIVRKSNTGAFTAGDIIQITEKIDGANASIAWNKDLDKLEVFSRTNLLNGVDGLRGFKQRIELDSELVSKMKRYPDYVIFGEWLVSHCAKYEKDAYSKWYVYDIWDKISRNYLPQDAVKKIASELDLEYVHVLYEGQFISWDHCRTFMNLHTYGPDQEGIVVKNQTKLSDDEVRAPKYLKIVNDAFRESHGPKAHEKKPIDPAAAAEEAAAKEVMSTVVTEARVRKMILKCVDEGIVPKDLTPKCIGALMKVLPKRMYDDLLKEEPETLKAAGSYAGKFASGLTAEFVKKIILGK